MAPKSFKSPQEAESEFFRYLGRAVTLWAHIDEEMFSICSDILKLPERLVAIIYFQSPTINGRLGFVNELVKVQFPRLKSGEHSDPVLVEWTKIKNDIDHAIRTRNQLAHSPTAARVEINGVTQGAEPSVFVLNTEFHYVSYISGLEKDREKNGKKVKSDLTLGMVGSHIKEVIGLIDRLRAIRLMLPSTVVGNE